MATGSFTKAKPSMPTASHSPERAKPAMVTSPVTVPMRRARSTITPSDFRPSQAAPWVSSIASDTTPTSNAKGFRKPEELGVKTAVIHRVKVLGQVKRHALQHVAHRHAEDQRRHGTTGKERPVPGRPPARIVSLGSVFEGHGPHDEGRQHDEHRQVEAREADRIERGPGGEDRAAA